MHFLSSKRAQLSSDDSEVSLAPEGSHTKRRKYVNRMGTCSAVNVYIQIFYQIMNRCSRKKVKESVMPNDFDVNMVCCIGDSGTSWFVQIMTLG